MISSSRLYFVALTALVSSATWSVAEAKCTIDPGLGYRPEQNDSRTYTMTCDTKGVTRQMKPGKGYVFTGISIASKPSSGTLKVSGVDTWSYTPKGAGSDSFTVKICATLNAIQSGCSLVTYSATNR